MGRFILLALIGSLLAAIPAEAQRQPVQIEIDLGQQMAYLVSGRRVLMASPISSGRSGYFTTRGSFKITEKKRQHFSSLYGKIVDRYGRTIVADADADMKVPRGGRFVPAPMNYFMRYNGAEGMHAGYLPGYAASHGCVRMPEDYAIAFFDAVQVGTRVNVFGRTPRTGDYQRYGPQPYRGPRQQRRYQFDPRRDPRFFPPAPYYDPRSQEPVWDPYQR